MGPNALFLHREEVMLVAVERNGGQQLMPLAVLNGLALGMACLDRGARRVVAGEVGGVEVDAPDAAGKPQAQNATVMPLNSLAPRFPTIHPFAVLVVFSGDERGR